MIPLVRSAPRAHPSAAGGAVRHLRLDEPLLAHVPALPARASPTTATACSVFVFGTRLTNITRQLRHRDVDVAMTRVADAIDDWSGGTRIGACLHEFNWRWSRRVLGQNACVLLITDGLDREGGRRACRRRWSALRKSCRQLIWLNPLLRYDGFEARPRACAPCCRTWTASCRCTTCKSLIDLAAALREPGPFDKRRSPREKAGLKSVCVFMLRECRAPQHERFPSLSSD